MTVLARRDDALSPEETEELLRERLGDAVLRTHAEYGTFTVVVEPAAFGDTARLCRDERVLAYDFFDCLFGLDARNEGFDVVAILYSTSTGNRLCLRTRCPGGREEPTCPTITDVYRGADWHERETWDMFGIEFTDHPGLEPRILTVENFEGWPLRKDFHLASRVAKPWPGVKEPAELDEDGNVIERVPRIGDAPGPYELDKAMAEQAKLANPAPDTPAEVEEPAHDSEEKPEVGDAEAKAPTDIDQATYDALIAEGKSERIARSKAKAAFVKKQRQQAADDASDEVAETESGEAVAEDAARADTAEDSGQVLAGDVEQDAEEAEAQATEVTEEAAGQAAHEEAEAAAERVEGGEVDASDAESASQKAEDRRKAAAEARARKAAERAETEESGEGSESAADENRSGDRDEDPDAGGDEEDA